MAAPCKSETPSWSPLGRLAAGVGSEIHLNVAVVPSAGAGDLLAATAVVRSSTTLPVQAHSIRTRVTPTGFDSDRDD